MCRAAFPATWLLMMVVVTSLQPCLASYLSKSPSPDKNGLPAPLNLSTDYGGLNSRDTAGSDTSEAFSSTRLLQPPAPAKVDDSDIHLYLNEKSSMNNPSSVAIDALESKCFSHTYTKESLEARLSRLEQFVFGKTFTTATPEVRLEKIAKVIAPPLSIKSANENSSSEQISAATGSNAPVADESLISVINKGIDHYNLHDYQHAEDDFDKCCAMAPDMARVHSYLAITKLQENERQSALQEFRTTYEIDPFGTYGRYAKLCLLKLAGDEEIRKRGPVDSEEILQSSLSKINNQSANLINFHNHESTRSTPVPANTGSFFAAQIDSTRARNNTVLQNAYTQESANNLKHLMGLRAKPGDAHLRAWGTNLNTRYYGTDTYLYAPYYIPREYPVELKAQQNTLAAPNKTKNNTQNSKKVKHHV